MLRASGAALVSVLALHAGARSVNPATNGAHRIASYGESEGDARADERDGNKSFFIGADEVPLVEKVPQRECECVYVCVCANAFVYKRVQHKNGSYGG